MNITCKEKKQARSLLGITRFKRLVCRRKKIISDTFTVKIHLFSFQLRKK